MECKYFKCITITSIVVGLIVFIASSIINKYFYSTVIEVSQYFAWSIVIVFSTGIVFLGVEVYFYAKNKIYGYYDTKKQELEDKYNALMQEKEHELQELDNKLKRYAETIDDIEEIRNATKTLFDMLLLNCNKFITSKTALLEALRSKKAKHLDDAVKHMRISEKGAQKAFKKFNKVLEEAKLYIEQEEKAFNRFLNDKDVLIKRIDDTKKLFKNINQE